MATTRSRSLKLRSLNTRSLNTRSLNTRSLNTRSLNIGDAGQSLIEVALALPIFTILICYAVDCGYFFLVAASVNAAARNAVEYAIQGSASPAQTAQPNAAAVANLGVAAIGLSGATTTTVSVRVCSAAVGTTLPANTAQCTTPTSGAGSVTGSPDTDPESPTFQLTRVDVVYNVSPPIPIPVSVFPTRSFHREAEMRRVQ